MLASDRNEEEKTYADKEQNSNLFIYILYKNQTSMTLTILIDMYYYYTNILLILFHADVVPLIPALRRD